MYSRKIFTTLTFFPFVFYCEILNLLQNKRIAIFDLDGIIADTERFHWMAHAEVLKEYDVVLTEELIEKYIGYNDDQIFGMVEEDFGVKIDKKKQNNWD